MSFLLFLDESGIDGQSPYEVLAGVCFEDSDLWNFIQQIHEAEEAFFGCRMTSGVLEMKGKKLLSKDVFLKANALKEFSSGDRLTLVKEFLKQNELCRGTQEAPKVTREQFAAFGQAKLAFVNRVFERCISYRAKAFASILPRKCLKSDDKDFLRKDYAFLFERYYYFLEKTGSSSQGLIVFDELEKSQSHLLIDQMERYFTRTANGRARSNRIIPEPFFVHSHLTTLIQVADIIAYTINWGLRLKGMSGLARKELEPYAKSVLNMQSKTNEYIDGREQTVWSLKYLSDLKPKYDK